MNRWRIATATTAAIAILSIAVAAFLFLNQRGDGDRVVGVLIRCEVGQTTTNGSGGRSVVYHPETSGGCYNGAVRNLRKEVAVKSGDRTYTVDVPESQSISVGDDWPPP